MSRAIEVAAMAGTSLLAQADPEKAGGMQGYLKTDMPFYGVQKPARSVTEHRDGLSGLSFREATKRIGELVEP